MMKDKICFAVCFLSALFLFAEENVSFFSREIIVSGENNYKGIVLDKDVLTKAARDFRDIRIINDEGEYVSYFLYDSLDYENMIDASFDAEFIDSFIQADEETNINYAYFDFKIQKEENTDVYGNQLELHALNSDFAETVEIFGSHDGINWTPLTSAFIYDVRELSFMTIPFLQTEKYSYYRIKAKENTVRINALRLVYQELSQDKKLFTKSFHPDFSIEQKEKNTIITIPQSEIRFLHVDSVHFETSGTFQRDVRTLNHYDEIYRFSFREELLEKNYINIDTQAPDEDLLIAIYNADDKALDIADITVSYRLQKLVFNADNGESFFLHYGNAALAKPDYDIENYREYILQEGFDACALGEIIEHKTEDAKLFFGMTSEKVFMNGIMIIAACALLIIIIAGMKKHGNT